MARTAGASMAAVLLILAVATTVAATTATTTTTVHVVGDLARRDTGDVFTITGMLVLDFSAELLKPSCIKQWNLTRATHLKFKGTGCNLSHVDSV